MTSAQVVETSVKVTSNSPSQDYTHPDDHNLLTKRRENKRYTYDWCLQCDSYNDEEEEEVNSVFCELNVLQSSSPAEPSDLQVSTRIVWHSPRTKR